jgi:hypothetical protein
MSKSTRSLREASLAERNGLADVSERPASPAPSGRSPGRRAFCPLCGREQADKPVSQVASPEGALCADRCAVAWRVLDALRLCESGNERLTARRRLEWETSQPHSETLSELLLGRWRAGDWAVAPEDLLRQL